MSTHRPLSKSAFWIFSLLELFKPRLVGFIQSSPVQHQEGALDMLPRFPLDKTQLYLDLRQALI